MEDISTFGYLIRDLGPAVVFAAAALGALWYYRNDIRGVFISITERNARVASASEKDTEARIESNELMRLVRAAMDNNSSVVDNNTAALNATSEERHLTREAIQAHDARSATQFEQLKSELGKARGDIGILKERTK